VKTAGSDTELAAIIAIVESRVYVDTCGQPYHGLLTGRIAAGPYSFDVAVLPETAKVMDPDITGRQIRAHLLERAEETLDALGAAGWHLTAYPRMEINGEVRRFAQYLDGTLAEPSKQGGISMRMRFEVDRPR
jgi:hypothetical protein